jgi:hypothetical protein
MEGLSGAPGCHCACEEHADEPAPGDDDGPPVCEAKRVQPRQASQDAHNGEGHACKQGDSSLVVTVS